MKTNFTWIALALICTPVIAWGQEKIELKPRWTKGDVWSIHRVTTMDQTNTIKEQGQITSRNHQRTKSVFQLEHEVLKVVDNEVASARVTFSKDCVTEMEQDGQKQSQPFPAAGQTITATRKGDDVEIVPASAKSPELIAFLEEVFESDSGTYPKKPISVGESWSWTREAVANTFGIGPDDKGTVTFTLKEISTRGNRPIAKVDIDIHYTQGVAQMADGYRVASLTETTLKGTGVMDIPSGLPVEMDLSGAMMTSGTISVPDASGNMTPQADLDNQGTLSLRSSMKLLKTAGKGKTPPATKEAGKTPIVAGDLTGEYTNPEITLTLQKSGAGYTGTLKFGDNQFPVKAAADGAGLKGSFKSDDTWFDFTATISSRTMSFATGGKTHELQKKTVAKNPLGAGSAAAPKKKPANPLGGGTPSKKPSRAE